MTNQNDFRRKFFRARFVGALGVFLALVLALRAPALAQAPLDANAGASALGSAQLARNFGSPQNIMNLVFRIIISISGTVFFLLLLIGGVRYLTAGGNEEATSGAKKLLLDALIGLVITLSAWGVGIWLLGSLGFGFLNGSGGSGGGGASSGTPPANGPAGSPTSAPTSTPSPPSGSGGGSGSQSSNAGTLTVAKSPSGNIYKQDELRFEFDYTTSGGYTPEGAQATLTIKLGEEIKYADTKKATNAVFELPAVDLGNDMGYYDWTIKIDNPNNSGAPAPEQSGSFFYAGDERG